MGLRIGNGMLSGAARSLPDTDMAVSVPFTPPLNRLQLDSLKGQVEKQACDKVEVKVEIGEGLALDAVVSLPCTSKTMSSQPALNTPEMAVMSEELFGHQLVAGGTDYDVEKANSIISQSSHAAKGAWMVMCGRRKAFSNAICRLWPGWMILLMVPLSIAQHWMAEKNVGGVKTG